MGPATAIIDGATLRAARRHAGMTQAELAARVGTTQSAIARWERGAVSPSLATAQALLHALGRRLEVAEPEPTLAPEERARIEENLRLTPEQRLARVSAAARFVLAGRRALAAARD